MSTCDDGVSFRPARRPASAATGHPGAIDGYQQLYADLSGLSGLDPVARWRQLFRLEAAGTLRLALAPLGEAPTRIAIAVSWWDARWSAQSQTSAGLKARRSTQGRPCGRRSTAEMTPTNTRSRRYQSVVGLRPGARRPMPGSSCARCGAARPRHLPDEKGGSDPMTSTENPSRSV